MSAADFQFGLEREAELPNADKRMFVLAAAMTGGFIAIVALILLVIIVVQHAA